MTTNKPRVPVNKVQLAVSPIGPGAYHSSILVNGQELSFSDAGISSADGPMSHTQMQQQAQGRKQAEPKIIDYGMSFYTGSQVRSNLERHFAQGTYDLLRKNCNSFSDCALFYLTHKRMDRQYRSMERLGARFSGIVTAGSGGQYTPNPKAADFDLEKLIESIDPEKVWKTPGHATGGNTVTDAGAMREARLAALNRSTASPEGEP